MSKDMMDILKKDWIDLQNTRRMAQLKKLTQSTEEDYVEFIVRAKVLGDEFEGWIRLNKENCVNIFRYMCGLRQMTMKYSQLRDIKEHGINGIRFNVTKLQKTFEYEIFFRDNLARKMAMELIQTGKLSEGFSSIAPFSIYLSRSCLV